MLERYEKIDRLAVAIEKREELYKVILKPTLGALSPRQPCWTLLSNTTHTNAKVIEPKILGHEFEMFWIAINYWTLTYKGCYEIQASS